MGQEIVLVVLLILHREKAKERANWHKQPLHRVALAFSQGTE